MNELDREQIIKELEGLVNFITCPDYIKYALSLIKELTEDVERLRKQCGEIIVECDERDAERLKQVAELTAENERLRADVAKEFTCVFGKPHKVSDCPITDEIAKAKADTVRKMAELIKERCIEGGIYPAFVASTIDQIAKEMEEGKI